jgi:hypothetical protein
MSSAKTTTALCIGASEASPGVWRFQFSCMGGDGVSFTFTMDATSASTWTMGQVYTLSVK